MRRPLSALGMGCAVLICTLLAVPDAYPAGPGKAGNPGEVVMASCGACHSLGKVCKNLGAKDKEAWSRTVAGMVKKGARVEQQDMGPVAEYLAGLKPGSKPVCK